jgi:hypothetical protein
MMVAHGKCDIVKDYDVVLIPKSQEVRYRIYYGRIQMGVGSAANKSLHSTTDNCHFRQIFCQNFSAVKFLVVLPVSIILFHNSVETAVAGVAVLVSKRTYD